MTSLDLRSAEAFLYQEATLLDQGKHSEWLRHITEDITYQVPVRVTRYGRPDEEFSRTAYHFNEDYYTLTKRVERLESLFAWAEDPPTRYRHFISNVQILETKKQPNELGVRSNVMLLRTRFDEPASEILTGERTDTLRYDGFSIRLAERVVLLDQTTLPVATISTFL